MVDHLNAKILRKLCLPRLWPIAETPPANLGALPIPTAHDAVDSLALCPGEASEVMLRWRHRLQHSSPYVSDTRRHGAGGDRRGLVLDGLGRRASGRATAPPGLA